MLAIGKIGTGIMNLLLLVSQTTNVEIQTYESHVTLRSYTPPHVCMLCVVCRVCGLGATYTSKQNIFSLILLILLAKLTNQKRGIYRLRPPFPNDDKTLKRKGGLRPD